MIETVGQPTPMAATGVGTGFVQEFIARENIKRFQAQLDACPDPEQKAVLNRLLKQEQQLLETLLAEQEGQGSRRRA